MIVVRIVFKRNRKLIGNTKLESEFVHVKGNDSFKFWLVFRTHWSGCYKSDQSLPSQFGVNVNHKQTFLCTKMKPMKNNNQKWINEIVSKRTSVSPTNK